MSLISCTRLAQVSRTSYGHRHCVTDVGFANAESSMLWNQLELDRQDCGLLTYLSSSSPVGHKATTMLRHKVLSFAEAWASPQDSPISFSSVITDCRHVIFGRPRFLFPGGVHLSATLWMLSWGIRRTCPSHLSRLRLISRTALLQPVFL